MTEEFMVMSPSLFLVFTLLLAVVIGFLQVFQIKDFLKRRPIWNLFTWFTIILYPLIAIPDALKYHNIELWYFFPIFAMFFGIWAGIGIVYRKSAGKYVKEYQSFIAIFSLYSLTVGMIIFWLIQATDVI